MKDRSQDPRSKSQLLEEIERLQYRLEEAEETLQAIRHAEVDALVVAGPQGEQVFSITGAEHVYRVIVETMNEAALTVDPDGTILFCNQRFCDLMKTSIQGVMGRKVTTFVARPQRLPLQTFLAEAQAGPVQRRLTLRAADGTAAPVQLAAGPLQAEDSTTICLVASDLSELEASAKSIRVLRQHEQAIQEANERLQAQSEKLRSQNEELQTQSEELRAQTGELAAANAALSQGEERYRLAVRATQDAIWDLDLATGAVHWNETYEKAFGRPPETDNSWQWWIDRIHAEDRERTVSNLRAAIDGQDSAWTCEYRFLRADGTWGDIYDRAYIARNSSGQAQRVIGAMQDRTQRKRAERELFEAQQRLLALMNALPVGVSFSDDPTCQRITGNPAVLAQFGADPRDNLSASAPDPSVPGRQVRLFHEGRQITDAELPLQRAVAENREIPPMELEVELPSGRRWFAAASGAPIRDASGNVIGGVAVTADITERRRAEEALRELNATLERKVAQRTAELRHRARQLQKLTLELSETEDRERRRLAEILHDDLQQQLAAAKFHLSLLNNRARHDPAQLAVVAQVDQMLMDAVEKSRSLSHELSPGVLYHADFAGALSWLARQLHAKHGLEVAVDAFGEVSVHSDALKGFLYKSAQELLFNVVKHARANKARIRVRRLGRCICLSVSDRGRGFDPRDLRQTRGFGLLSIRERIELLGGRMKIHSVKGQGTTFHIVVPDSPVAENSYPAAGAAPHAGPTSEVGPDGHGPAGHGGPPLRVLLADDHEIVREGLRSLLSDEPGVEVVGEAANGREAVDQAYRLQPDVVIMDVAMPLINGDDATRQIKMHLPKTRVIALSMYEEPETVEKMRRAGAEGYILKTVASEELLAAIRVKSTPT